MNKNQPTKHLKNIRAIAIKGFSLVKRYMPVLVGVCFSIATGVRSPELEQQVAQIDPKTASEAARIKVQLTQQIKEKILALASIAKHWEKGSDRAIGWVDPTLQISWRLLAENQKFPDQKFLPEQPDQIKIAQKSEGELLAQHRSFLPEIILSAGILISLAIGGNLYIIKIQQKRTKNLLTINQKLQREITERQIEVESLLKKQQQYKSLVNCVDGIVWKVDIKTLQFTFVSQRAEKLLGYPIEKWLKEPNFWADHIHPEDRDWAIKFCLENSQKKSEYQFEYRMIAADGKILWLRDIVTVIFANEIPIEMQGVLIDITTNKQSEVELRLSEERYRRIVETASEGILVIDSDYKIVFGNNKIAEMLGYKLDEIIGRNLANFIDEKDQNIPSNIKSIFPEEQAKIDFKFRRKDSTEMWAIVSTNCIFDPTGKSTGMLGMITDITSRKQAEEALRESEERWQLALRGNNDGIWDWNVKTNEVFFSLRWKEMLGYQEDEIVNHLNEWSSRVHPDDIFNVKRAIEDHFAKKTPFYISEHRILCKNGSNKWVLDRGQALWDENGNVIRMTGSHTDITERKHQEEELRWQEALLRAMASASPLAFYVVDNRTDVILYFNHRFCQIWGIENLEEKMQRGELKNSDIILKCLPQLVHAKAFIESCKHLESEENTKIIEDEIPLKSGITIRRFSAQIRDRADCYFGRLYMFEDVTERKRSEQDLKEAKDRFELAICASNDGFWDWQLSTGKIYFSHRWKEMIGYKNYELPNELYSWEKVIFEEDRIAALKMIDDYNSGKIPRFLTTQRFHHKNGSTVYVLSRAIHLKDGTGKVVRMIGAHTDITELINAQEQLRKSEQHTRALLDAIPDLMFRLRSDGSYLDFNGNQNKLLMPVEKFVGNNLIDAPLDEEHKKYLLNMIKRAAKTGELQTYEHELKTHAGIGKYESRIVKSSDDEVVWIIRDITERNQAEKALKESQHFIQRIADASPNILYIYDLIEKRSVYVNSETVEILGYTPQAIKEMGSDFLTQLAHPEDINCIKEHLNKFNTAKDGEIIETEYRLKHRSGEWRWLYCRDTIFTRTADGKPQQILGNSTDISKRKQMEEALYQVNEKLQSWVKKLEERNQEIIYLGQLNDVLQACLTVEEAYSAIAQMMEPLFPEMNGAIFTISASRKLVEAVATWGTQLTSQSIFTPNECWALRRGREYFLADSCRGLTCQHLQAQSLPIESICIPMMAQGESIGMLYLSSQKIGLLTEQKQILARTVSEHIAMALANLKLRETLQHQSIRDPLTGLFNRRYLEESLEREIHRADRKQQSLGIIMLDVDHFKRFNDTYGHDAGDAVLRELGLFLQKYIRGSDIACRYGGEELTLILPEASIEVTAQRAEQLRQGVKHLNVQHHSQPLGVITLSLGVAVFPTHGITGEAVIQTADHALYRAKKEGRDRVVTAS